MKKPSEISDGLFYAKARSNFEVFLQIILKIRPLEVLVLLKLPIKENISV